MALDLQGATLAEWQTEYRVLLRNFSAEETLLERAPFAIFMLAQVLLISTPGNGNGNEMISDFALVRPPGGFQYLQYTYFRAAMAQLAHEGYYAFLNAHSSMDRVRIYTHGIPTTVETLTSLLEQGSEEEIRLYLPRLMKRLAMYSNESMRLTEATATRFKSMSNLTSELIRACVNTRGVSSEQNMKLQKQLALARRREELMRQKQERSKELVAGLKTGLEQHQQEFFSALRTLPSASSVSLEAHGKIFVSTMPTLASYFIFGPASAVFTGLTTVFVGIENRIRDSNSVSLDADLLTDSDTVDGRIGVNELYEIQAHLMFAETARAMANAGLDETKTNTTNWMLVKVHSPAWRLMMQLIGDVLPKLDENAENKQLASELVALGTEIINKLGDLQRRGQTSLPDGLKAAVRRFKTASLALEIAGANALRVPVATPRLRQQQQQDVMLQTPADYSIFGKSELLAAYEMRVQASSVMLHQAMHNYYAELDQHNRLMRKLMDLAVEIQRIDLFRMSVEETIALLEQVLEHTDDLLQGWQKVAQFMQSMANIINVYMHGRLGEFSGTAQIRGRERIAIGRRIGIDAADGSENVTAAIASKSAMLQLLYQSAFRCSTLAQYVHSISTTYTSLSRGYYLPELTAMNSLFGLDRFQDAALLKRLRQEMFAKFETAKNATVAAINEHHNSLVQQTDQLMTLYGRKLATIELKRTEIQNEDDFFNSLTLESGLIAP